jgi:hypothetical protein
MARASLIKRARSRSDFEINRTISPNGRSMRGRFASHICVPYANFVPARPQRPGGDPWVQVLVGTLAIHAYISAVATSYAQIGVGFRSKHCLVWPDSPEEVFLARA